MIVTPSHIMMMQSNRMSGKKKQSNSTYGSLLFPPDSMDYNVHLNIY